MGTASITFTFIYPLLTAKIRPIIHHISETVHDTGNLLLLTHRKSHRGIHWYRNWWPWVTLNRIMAVILGYFTELGTFSASGWSWTHAVRSVYFAAMHWMVIFSEMTEKDCVTERRPALDSEKSNCATCAAMSAIAEFFFEMYIGYWLQLGYTRKTITLLTWVSYKPYSKTFAQLHVLISSRACNISYAAGLQRQADAEHNSRRLRHITAITMMPLC